MSETFYYIFQTFLRLLPWGLLFLLIGWFIGWALWRNYKEKAAEIERRNERLRDQEQGLKDEHQRLLNEYAEAQRAA